MTEKLKMVETEWTKSKSCGPSTSPQSPRPVTRTQKSSSTSSTTASSSSEPNVVTKSTSAVEVDEDDGGLKGLRGSVVHLNFLMIYDVIFLTFTSCTF